MTEPTVFFEQRGSYRRWPYVIFLLFFSALALLGLTFFGYAAVVGKLTFEHPLALFFAIAWTSAMTAASAYLIWCVIFRPGSYAHVDEHGIEVDERTWSWNDVDCIFAQRAGIGRRVALMFQLKRQKGFNHPAQTFPYLTSEEANAILDRVGSYLAERFPDVGVG